MSTSQDKIVGKNGIQEVISKKRTIELANDSGSSSLKSMKSNHETALKRQRDYDSNPSFAKQAERILTSKSKRVHYNVGTSDTEPEISALLQSRKQNQTLTQASSSSVLNDGSTLVSLRTYNSGPNSDPPVKLTFQNIS